MWVGINTDHIRVLYGLGREPQTFKNVQKTSRNQEPLGERLIPDYTILKCFQYVPKWIGAAIYW